MHVQRWWCAPGIPWSSASSRAQGDPNIAFLSKQLAPAWHWTQRSVHHTPGDTSGHGRMQPKWHEMTKAVSPWCNPSPIAEHHLRNTYWWIWDMHLPWLWSLNFLLLLRFHFNFCTQSHRNIMMTNEWWHCKPRLLQNPLLMPCSSYLVIFDLFFQQENTHTTTTFHLFFLLRSCQCLP